MATIEVVVTTAAVVVAGMVVAEVDTAYALDNTTNGGIRGYFRAAVSSVGMAGQRHSSKDSRGGIELLGYSRKREQVHLDGQGLGAGAWLRALAPAGMDTGRQRRGMQLRLDFHRVWA